MIFRLEYISHVRLIKIYCNCYPTGKKDNGEGGIFFDKEEEKEQWEDDQKVSCSVVISCYSQAVYGFMCFKTDLANFPGLAAI